MAGLSEMFDQLRDWVGLGRPPLQRAIRRAYRQLEAMTSDGVPMPDDISRQIMIAAQAERANALTPEIEAAFYVFNARLVRLRRGQTHGGDDAKAPFADALDDADLLLKFAAETGNQVPRETINPLLAAKEAAANGTLTQDMQARFYEAYGKLCKQFGEVTADTIRACRSEQTRRMLSCNRIVALVLTTGIAVGSVTVFVADSLSANIETHIKAANEAAARLRATISQNEITDSTMRDGLDVDPCEMLTTPPANRGRDRMAATEIEPLQHFAANVRDIRSQAIKLNVFVGRIECDPFASCDAPRGGMCQGSCYDGSAVPVADRFELNPAIRNYTAEVLCKIKTYQSVRSFASNVQADYKAAIGALASYAFPIFYALLGAYAFRLRLFVDTIRNRTYHPSFADSARMITAVIAGAIAGLFNPATGFSLSPLATAFLVGYGVELFFRFLDTLLNAFGSSSATSPRPPRVQS